MRTRSPHSSARLFARLVQPKVAHLVLLARTTPARLVATHLEPGTLGFRAWRAQELLGEVVLDHRHVVLPLRRLCLMVPDLGLPASHGPAALAQLLLAL